MSGALDGLFSWTLAASLHASVLVVLVLAAQTLFRRQLTPRWRYALWLLVVVRLMLPAVPESSHSIFNWMQQEQLAHLAPDALPALNVTAFAPPAAVTEPLAVEALPLPPPPASKFTLRQLTVFIWAAGAVAFLVVLLCRTTRLTRSVARQPAITDERVVRLLEEARRDMGLRRRILLVYAPAGLGPCLVGGIRPRVVLPRDLVHSLTDAQLRHVLLHELAHLRRHDIALNWLLAMLQALHWPNAVMWYAFRRLRADRELACDAAVLAKTGADDAGAYAGTLIHILEQQRPLPFMPGAAGVFESKNGLKRRIAMIANFRTRHRLWSILPLALLMALGYVGMTAANPPGEREAEVPVTAATPPVEASELPVRADPVVSVPESPPEQTPAVSETADAELLGKLNKSVSVEFEQIHLSDILGILNDNYEINFVLDTDAVAPAPTPESGLDPSSGQQLKEGQVSGHVTYIKLTEVTLAQGLDALLRPLSLDYAVRSNYIFISTPERLKEETSTTTATPTLPPSQPPAVEPAQVSKLQKVLQAPVNLEFEKIHVSDVIAFISDSYDLNIVLDGRAVAPASASGVIPDPKPGQVAGFIESLDLTDVTLRSAFGALLRPLGLDFSVQPEYLWISTPELLKHDGFKAELGTPPAAPVAVVVPTPVDAQERVESPISLTTSTDSKLSRAKPGVHFDNVPLRRVLELLADRHGLAIRQDTRVSSFTEPVTCDYQDMELGVVLQEIVSKSGLAYSFSPHGYIWISTPEMMKAEGFEPVDIAKLGSYGLPRRAQETPEVPIKEVSVNGRTTEAAASLESAAETDGIVQQLKESEERFAKIVTGPEDLASWTELSKGQRKELKLDTFLPEAQKVSEKGQSLVISGTEIGTGEVIPGTEVKFLGYEGANPRVVGIEVVATGERFRLIGFGDGSGKK